MKILALDTATDACSAALFMDGDILEEFAVKPREHTKLILPMADRLLAQAQLRPAQLDAVAFSRGPGSFTGVRIAGGVAHGIALGADLPVLCISTLAMLAQNLFNQEPAAEIAFTGIDARMDEVYWGVYRRNRQNLAELAGVESVCKAGAVEFPAQAGFGIGSAWRESAAELTPRLGMFLSGVWLDAYPRAAAAAQLAAADFALGRAVAVENALPVYLRDKVAHTEAERKQELLHK